MPNNQQDYDHKNAQFWNELCGSGLALSLGITEVNAQTLQLFDKAYLDYYPYLAQYVLKENLKNKRVLEIGLGYGTLGNLIASQGSDYYGLDVAEGPVRMIQYRLALLGQEHTAGCQEGSALALPHEAASFDYVYSIGCLHHTGDLPKSVSEIHRVLRPGGKAIIMLYNRHSFRQLMKVSLMSLKSRVSLPGKRTDLAERIRALYDTNTRGDAAPFIEYVSRAEVRQIFRRFSEVHIDVQNFDAYSLWKGRLVLRREWFLNNLARILGLDLYIEATK